MDAYRKAVPVPAKKAQYSYLFLYANPAIKKTFI